LVTGSRKYSNYPELCKGISIIIDDLARQGAKEITFLQGGAPGADTKAVEFINIVEKSVFKLTGVKIRYKTFTPDWKTHGKAAGPLRNKQMVDENPVHALVFLERGEPNIGTLGTVKMLIKAGIPFTPYGAVEMLDRM
jgi:hypothetical protein